ncbi:glycosyltransferase [Alphaproteobacteria bacterium]|nr:glycosyltransferase [Alphaproteobacteria bacterium]
MKILFIITGLNLGGAERSLVNTLHGEIGSNNECFVISLHSYGHWGAQLEDIGVPVYSLDIGDKGPRRAKIVTVVKFLINMRFDIIQGWMYHGNIVASIVRFFFSRKAILIWNVRQTLYDIKYEKKTTRLIIFLSKFFSKFVDKVIYNSHLSLTQHQKYGFQRLRSIVIPNAFDPAKISSVRNTINPLRQKLGLKPTDVLIGHVARLHPMKGHNIFVEAAVQILKKYPTTSFVMVGKNVSYKKDSFLSMMSNEHQKRFHFFDQVDDIYSLMQEFDIFCLSSSWGEGFPNVIAEAMLLEVPCVATDVGDASRIINEASRVVPPGSSHLLAEALINLINCGKVERTRIGWESRRWIIENYHIEYVSRHLHDLYCSLVMGRH